MSSMARGLVVIIISSSPRGVAWAGKANQDGFLVHTMIPLPVSAAWVNRMAMIDTATDAVLFDELNAHVGIDRYGRQLLMLTLRCIRRSNAEPMPRRKDRLCESGVIQVE